MAKFRKKPVVIDAFQWTGGPDQTEDPVWIVEALDKSPSEPGAARISYPEMRIYTLEGVMVASPGDWIIRGVKGELYPCKPDVFATTYEPVEAVVPHASDCALHNEPAMPAGPCSCGLQAKMSEAARNMPRYGGA